MAISKTAAGTWAVDFRSQDCHCDKIQGQHRHRIQKTLDTYKGAVAYEKEKLDEVEKREFVKPSDKTVREIAEEWYQKKVDAGTYRRASLIDYHNHVENYIKRQLGNWKVHDIDVEKIEKAAAEWGKKVSPKMVNKALTTHPGAREALQAHQRQPCRRGRTVENCNRKRGRYRSHAG